MGAIKLERLPDRTPVKMTISVSPDLHRALGDYAEAYEAAYGQPECVAELIPAMIAAFLQGDRAFARSRKNPAGRTMSAQRSGGDGMITVEDFARLARLSRRQIDRLRERRPPGFPREYELGSGSSKYRRCPRFRLRDVQRWLDSRALW